MFSLIFHCNHFNQDVIDRLRFFLPSFDYNYDYQYTKISDCNYDYDYLPQIIFSYNYNYDYRSINFLDYNYDYDYKKIDYNRNQLIMIIIDPNPAAVIAVVSINPTMISVVSKNPTMTSLVSKALTPLFGTGARAAQIGKIMVNLGKIEKPTFSINNKHISIFCFLSLNFNNIL